MKKLFLDYRNKWVAGLVFAAFAGLVLVTACKKNKGETQAEYKPIVEAVYASGNVLPADDYKLYSLADGYLLDKFVTEGQEIKKGEALFKLQGEQQAARLANSQSAYQMAENNYGANSPALLEMKANVRTAETKFKNDSVNYYRYKNLLEHNATSQAEYDRAQLAWQTSRNDYMVQKERYSKTRNQLYLELENAKGQLRVNVADEGNYTLRSTMDGVVYEVYKKQGELVKRLEPIALLGSGKKTYLKLSVDELDINKVKVGQDVFVKIDVYKGKVFKGKITKIYPMLNQVDQSFRVDAEFTEEAPKAYSGLTVEANIIIQQKEKALVIPRAYLVGEDSVWIKEGKNGKKIHIRKGAETLENVEVLEGLDQNTTLIRK